MADHCLRLPATVESDAASGLAAPQRVQIDRFVLFVFDAFANLLGCPAQLRHLVRVGPLRRAGRADRSVRPLKAAVQARVPQRPIASAIARQLIQHLGNLRGFFVDLDLPLLAEERSRQLISRRGSAAAPAPSPAPPGGRPECPAPDRTTARAPRSSAPGWPERQYAGDDQQGSRSG